MNKEEREKALEIAKAVDRQFFHVYTMEDLYKNKGHKNVIECFEQLIKEHFELKEKYKQILDDVHDYRFETHCMKMTIRNLCNHFGVKDENELMNIYLCQPYKFDDLKVGMWVFDSKAAYEDWTFIKITKILSKDDCEYLYHDKNKQVFFDNMECHAREWEENRFFPLSKAKEMK